jgi:hypothetical protein
MIGEIRDYETAQIAIQASLTGHLVLATLHTNDAPSAVTRLTDMGVEPFLLSSSLLGVLAQRLVRRLCEHCKEEAEGVARGCQHCGYTGYQGRTGIFGADERRRARARTVHTQAGEAAIREAALARHAADARDGERLIPRGHHLAGRRCARDARLSARARNDPLRLVPRAGFLHRICGPRPFSMGGALSSCLLLRLRASAAPLRLLRVAAPAASPKRGLNFALNMTIRRDPQCRRLHEIGVAADARLLAFSSRWVRLVGHQLAFVLAALRRGLRDAAAVRLRMRQPVVDGGTVFRQSLFLTMPSCAPARAGAASPRPRSTVSP